MTDSYFLVATLSQCTYMVIEDLFTELFQLKVGLLFNMILLYGRCAHARATKINSAVLSGPIKISGTFQQQLVPNGTRQHLILL